MHADRLPHQAHARSEHTANELAAEKELRSEAEARCESARSATEAAGSALAAEKKLRSQAEARCESARLATEAAGSALAAEKKLRSDAERELLDKAQLLRDAEVLQSEELQALRNTHEKAVQAHEMREQQARREVEQAKREVEQARRELEQAKKEKAEAVDGESNLESMLASMSRLNTRELGILFQMGQDL